jgi:hypothetical protein
MSGQGKEHIAGNESLLFLSRAYVLEALASGPVQPPRLGLATSSLNSFENRQRQASKWPSPVARVRKLKGKHLSILFTEHGKDKLDLLMLFSVTMWIHIHHGDEGLRDILLRLISFAGERLLEG